MKYISVCSGIEAATVAWQPLGWKALCFSEIEKFPATVLDYHYPSVPNHGDMTEFKEWPDYDPDVLVGGTPCQSFSVAGLRKGLDDPRGNLMLTYLAVADRYRPRWLVWENVPGVLSSNKGRDFGTFLGGLGELGYGFAYRVLDAQFFGVPQRRRRVFVVGCLGDWRRAAAVLFERYSLQGHTPPSKGEGKKVAGTITRGFGDRGVDSDQIANGNCVVMAHGQGNAEMVRDGSPSLTCNHEAPIVCHGTQDPCTSDKAFALGRNNGGENVLAVRTANTSANRHGVAEGVSHTIDGANGQCVAFAQNTRDEVREMEVAGALAAQPGAKQQSYLRQDMKVRRLTPKECERLQGFPDDYTKIPWSNKPAEQCPDGPRYKALGNSMAVPCMVWIGERINKIEAI